MNQEETLKDNPFGISENGSDSHFIDHDDYEELHRALKVGDYKYSHRSGNMFISDYFKVGRFLITSTGDFDQHYMICNHNKPGYMIYNTWLPVTCGKLWAVEREIVEGWKAARNKEEEAKQEKKYESSPVVAPLPNQPKKESCSGCEITLVLLAIVAACILIAASNS